MLTSQAHQCWALRFCEQRPVQKRMPQTTWRPPFTPLISSMSLLRAGHRAAASVEQHRCTARSVFSWDPLRGGAPLQPGIIHRMLTRALFALRCEGSRVLAKDVRIWVLLKSCWPPRLCCVHAAAKPEARVSTCVILSATAVSATLGESKGEPTPIPVVAWDT